MNLTTFLEDNSSEIIILPFRITGSYFKKIKNKYNYTFVLNYILKYEFIF